MTEQARIIEFQNDMIILACLDEGSCASCAGKGFCNVKGKSYTAVNAHNLDLSIGDDVEVYLPPGKTILSGFMVMMVPLLTFIAGYLAARQFLPYESEALYALGGFAGLAFGFAAAFLYGKTQKRTGQPVITRVIRP